MQKTIEKLLSTGDQRMTLVEFQDLNELGETRYIEKKSIRLLDAPKSNKDKIKESLGKESCAFANYEGGIILIGVDDKINSIETGVDNVFENKTLKEWLEDIVFVSVNPSLNDFAIKIIEKETKFLFAIIIAPSKIAPHQCSNNYVFYGRIDGKSRPLNGLMVRDIFNRKESTEITPTIEFELITYNSPSFCSMKVGVENKSNVCADEVLAIININSPSGIMNGGYHEGKSFFSDGKGQLYAELVYPKINQQFKEVKLKKFDTLTFTVSLVARNFPLTRLHIHMNMWIILLDKGPLNCYLSTYQIFLQ